jgi:hypothetical protein
MTRQGTATGPNGHTTSSQTVTTREGDTVHKETTGAPSGGGNAHPAAHPGNGVHANAHSHAHPRH